MKFRGAVVFACLSCALSAQQATPSGAGTVGTVLPQVAPGLQQNNNNGRGISFVTRPTPTAVNTSLARGFFAAGGVQLGGNGAAPTGIAPGGTAGAGTAIVATKSGAKPAAPAIPSNAEMSRLAAAASRGDAKAQARLTEIGRAIVANADATGR